MFYNLIKTNISSDALLNYIALQIPQIMALPFICIEDLILLQLENLGAQTVPFLSSFLDSNIFTQPYRLPVSKEFSFLHIQISNNYLLIESQIPETTIARSKACASR